ncbi:MAG: sugar phosphate isomerase/epimerase [Clostridia bacterium]|nr:sugar phosphate isomerase/epimerase [Clostridia bacterium]
MNKGISSVAFPAGMTIKEMFAEAKKHGFDGVELSMNASGELTTDTGLEELRQIKNEADNAGITLYSVTSGVCWMYSLTSDDEAQRGLAKENVKKQLDIAARLGCETILVVPGHVGVDFAPHLGVVEYETAYNRALNAIGELVPYAESAGVVMGIENVWNKFLVSPLEVRSFIDEINSPYVKAYFDVGNVLINSYPEHWITILGNRIAKVHFKDFKRSIGNINGFCDLLAGDVDYKAVMSAFKSVGYDGWVTAEVTPYVGDNSVMLSHTSAAMDYIIDI